VRHEEAPRAFSASSSASVSLLTLPPFVPTLPAPRIGSAAWAAAESNDATAAAIVSTANQTCILTQAENWRCTEDELETNVHLAATPNACDQRAVRQTIRSRTGLQLAVSVTALVRAASSAGCAAPTLPLCQAAAARPDLKDNT
jgi:hypothetical protein